MRTKEGLPAQDAEACESHQELEEAGTDFCLQPLQGAWARRDLDFGILTSRAQRIHFCYFKLLV